MKLWLLKARNEELPENDNPWEPWFNKAFGHVVCAETEEKARQIAHENAEDENRGEFLSRKISNTREPWKDPYYSSCEELIAGDSCEVILTDFARA